MSSETKTVLLLNPRQYISPYQYKLNAPYTLAYLARRLDDDKIGSVCVDLEGLGWTENKAAQYMEQANAVAITAMSVQAEGARRLLRMVRTKFPDKYAVVGGIDPTLDPQKYIEWGADAVVTGQADGNIADVISRQIKGIIPGKHGEIGGRPLWENHIPKPWQYPGHPKPLALPEAICMATRGCPYECTFCGNRIYQKQQKRRRSTADVRNELAWLKQNGINGVFFYDDEFIDASSLEYVLSLITNFDLLYRCQGRCNLSNDASTKAVLRQLRLHGLRRVMWGVESFDNGVLKAMKKHTNYDVIMDTLDVSASAGIENFLFLMAGMPGETQEAADNTYKGLESAIKFGLAHHIQVTTCTPMPGTLFYEQAEKGGWLGNPDAYQSAPAGGTPWLSQGEIAAQIGRLKALGAQHGLL